MRPQRPIHYSRQHVHAAPTRFRSPSATPREVKRHTKIRLDRSKRQAHGLCYAVNPELFPIDDDGYSTLTERSIELGDEQDALAAVAACPEDALIIRKD